jgi:hypothetical protein
VRQQVANLDPRLAPGRELRPVPGDGRVEVEFAAVHQRQRSERVVLCLRAPEVQAELGSVLLFVNPVLRCFVSYSRLERDDATHHLSKRAVHA